MSVSIIALYDVKMPTGTVTLYHSVIKKYCTIERQCNETEMRLAGGQTSFDGRVEMCLGGQWSSVCDDRWDHRDAAVVCRQLGYNGREFMA